MVFLVTAIITRIIDMATSVFKRISTVSTSTFEQGTLELVVFLKSIAIILINISLAFDAIVYLRMEKLTLLCVECIFIIKQTC
jgi:hypothetical protein